MSGHSEGPEAPLAPHPLTSRCVRCRPLSPHVDHYEIAVFLNDLCEADRESLEAYVSATAARPVSG